MELGTIEREIHIDAAPDVVFAVVSSPEHVSQWWPDEADFEPVPGRTGEIVFGERTSGEATVVALTVVEAEPPRRFSFRWTQPTGAAARSGNSLLVTFELTPAGAGTMLRLTETGFREMGWEAAVLEETYLEHSQGWDHFMARLDEYVTRLVSSR